MDKKIPKNLTQLVFEETKDFQKRFIAKYQPLFQRYQLKIYNSLIDCYTTTINDKVVSTLDSSSMIKYFDCYKSVLRQTRATNKRVYEESVDIDRKLKQCIEVKSNFSSSMQGYQRNKKECLQSYRDKYEALYSDVFGSQKQ